MCFSGSGGGSSGPQSQWYKTSSGSNVWAEQGLPQDAIDRNIRSVTAYQTQVQQDLSDKQLAAQKQIADQQNTFNEQQLQYQKDLQTTQQKAADEQAQRQTTYDTGRANLLAQGSQQINDAFSSFTPGYYDQYAKDYMSKAQDQIDYQKAQAAKQIQFGMARQGLINSQANVNEQGLLEETSGRATADQTANAQSAENVLKQNVAGAKQNLLGQVTSSESIGSPIAGSDLGAVNTALQTQGQAITGVTNTAGDVTSSLKAVPQVGTLANIFGGVLSDVGSYLGGTNAQNVSAKYNQGVAGLLPAAPSTGSTTIH